MLFRKEALEHQERRLAGKVLVAQPVAHWIYTAIAVLVVIAIVAFLFWGEYARKERVHGYLVPSEGVVKVRADRPGTINRVLVEGGDVVATGTPLLVVSSRWGLVGGGDVATAVIEQLKHERNQLEARIESVRALQALKRSKLQHRITGLNQETTGLATQYQTQRAKAETLRQQLERYDAMRAQGYLSQAKYDEHYVRYLAAKAAAQETHGLWIARKNSLTQAKDRLDALPVKTRKHVHKLKGKLARIAQQRAKIRGRRSYVIRAPVAGEVTTLQASPGQQVGDGGLLLTVLPTEAELRAYLYVPTRAIGFVEVGQAVQVQYRAFPHERFGTYSGEVIAVADAILSPREVPAPLALKKPVYRVKVALDSQTVTAYSKTWQLGAGMLLDADIILAHRSLVQWLLSPLYSLRGRI